MLVKLRENMFIGDEKITEKELKENGITVILLVADEPMDFKTADCTVFAVELHTDKVNKPHVKDIACHIAKYMAQSGETVVIISKKGLIRAPFVAARAVCEIENKTIYDIFVELQDKMKDFDIGKAYL